MDQGDNENLDNVESEKKDDSPVGPLVGIIIIIAVLIIGALYFWGSRLNRDQSDQSTTTPDTIVDTTPSVSTTTE